MWRATFATVAGVVIVLSGCKDDVGSTSRPAPPPPTTMPAAATQPAAGGRYWKVPVRTEGQISELMVYAEDADGAVRRAEELRHEVAANESQGVRLAPPAEAEAFKATLRLLEQSRGPPRPPNVKPGEPPRNPWAGFGEGSWVIIREKQVVDGKVRSQRTAKFSIAEHHPDSPWVSETPEVGGTFDGPSSRFLHTRGVVPGEAAVVATRQETLTVGGRKLDCTVNAHVHENEKTGRKTRLVVWRAAGVRIPYREIAVSGPDVALDTDVVKAEYSFEGGDGSGTYLVEVTSLDEKVKVGGRDLSCVVEKATGREVEGRIAVTDVRRWLSDEVPGRVVKFSGAAIVGGKTYQPEKTVVDFHASPRRNE